MVGQIRRMTALGPLQAIRYVVQAESKEQHALKLMVTHAGKTFAGHVERPVLGDRRACAQSITIGQQEREAGRMVGAEYPDVGIEIVGHGIPLRWLTVEHLTLFALQKANWPTYNPLI